MHTVDGLNGRRDTQGPSGVVVVVVDWFVLVERIPVTAWRRSLS